jgi:hypothetical protein
VNATSSARTGTSGLGPCRHDPSTHLHNNEITGEIEALTPTGAVHIRLLHLNRPPLIAHRLARSAVEIMRQRGQILEAQVEQREQTIQFLLSYIKLMNRLISVRQESEEQVAGAVAFAYPPEDNNRRFKRISFPLSKTSSNTTRRASLIVRRRRRLFMKVNWFHLMPYRWLPDNFKEKYHGV